MRVAEDRDNKIKKAVTGRQRLGGTDKKCSLVGQKRREEGEVGRWAQMESRQCRYKLM